MQRSIFPIAAAVVATAIGSYAWADMPVISAQQFVGQAGSGGILEVQSSELLLKEAGAKASPEVRAFAEKMIADHKTANEKLKTIATSQNLSVPEGLSAEDTALMDALKKASSDPATYAKMQLAGHAAMVTMFENYATKGDNLELKRFAMETLPTLEMHRDMAAKLPGAKEAATQ